jgi:hypothetical protein
MFSSAVPLLERDMPDGARLADDGRCIHPFNDRIPLQVVVKLLSGMPMPVQFLVGGNLDKVDEDLAPRSELR